MKDTGKKSRRRSRRRPWGVTRSARSFLRWCKDHPLPGVIALSVGGVIALFALLQGIEWAVGKIWSPVPRIVDVENERGAGGNFAITIENPTDMTMIVNAAVFRAEPPPDDVFAHFNELRIPAVTYEMPFDCSPGTKRIKLKPPFRVTAKNVGAVVFRSTVPMRECELYISLETSQGPTEEQQAVSLAHWQSRGP